MAVLLHLRLLLGWFCGWFAACAGCLAYDAVVCLVGLFLGGFGLVFWFDFAC